MLQLIQDAVSNVNTVSKELQLFDNQSLEMGLELVDFFMELATAEPIKVKRWASEMLEHNLDSSGNGQPR